MGKVTERTDLSTALAADDLLSVVDISDTTQSPEGTSKKVTATDFLGNIPGKLSLNAIDRIVASSTDIVTKNGEALYDTSRDSDGGKWRDRVSHTSLGKPPAFMGLIVEGGSVDTATIRDLTDPTTPVFKAWTLTDPNSVTALDGKIVIGTISDGMVVIDLIADEVLKYDSTDVSRADQLPADFDMSTVAWTQITTDGAIVGSSINVVAITVRPGSPIDTATGLPTPTYVVGTDTSLSVINDDGVVIDDTYFITNDQIYAVVTTDFGYGFSFRLKTVGINNFYYAERPWPQKADISSTPDIRYSFSDSSAGGFQPFELGFIVDIAVHENFRFFGVGDGGALTGGLAIVVQDNTTVGNSLFAAITNTWATPFMQGITELCLAGDSLTDRSITGTSMTDNGTATFAFVAAGAELEVTTAVGGTITATVTTGGECYGWELISSVWTFRRKLADWTGVSEAAGTLTIADTTAFTRLVYVDGDGPSDAQLDLIEALDRHLFKDNADMLLSGSSNVVASVAYDPDSDRLLAGTGDGTSFFRGLERVKYVDQAGTPTSDVVRSVAGARGAYLIGTAAETVYNEPSQNFRENEVKVDRDTQPPEIILTDVSPTDTGSTVVGAIPIYEGESATLTLTVNAVDAEDAIGTNNATYTIIANVYRVAGGNVTVEAQTAVSTLENTAGMACVVAANTSDQTVEVQVTGVSGKTIAWTTKVSINSNIDRWAR